MDDRPDSAFSPHRVDIADSRGVQAGDHNTQYNLFVVPPPPGPVVVHDGTLVDLAMKAAALLTAYAASLGEAWQNRRAVRDFVRQVTALAENVAFEPRAADDDRLLDLRSQTLWCVLELGSGSLSYQAVEIGEKLLADNERVRGSTLRKL